MTVGNDFLGLCSWAILALLYGLYHKTWSFLASMIWKKDSTGRLIETFSKIDFLKKFRPERLIEQDA